MIVEHDGKAGQLFASGEFPVDEQVGCLDEGGMLRQFLHRVAPVTEDPLFTVHEGDAALAGARVDEARIISDEALSAGAAYEMSMARSPSVPMTTGNS